MPLLVCKVAELSCPLQAFSPRQKELVGALTIGHSDIQANWSSAMESARVGKCGKLIVAKLRKRFAIEEGSLVTAEARENNPAASNSAAVPDQTHRRLFSIRYLQRNREIGA